MPPKTPIFGKATRLFTNDNITTANPWTENIPLGTYDKEVTGTYTPTLAPGASPKSSGTVIPNITDGSSGSAPDRGAVISGRAIPRYGDPANAPVGTRATLRP
jgi:hypothetical protein